MSADDMMEYSDASFSGSAMRDAVMEALDDVLAVWEEEYLEDVPIRRERMERIFALYEVCLTIAHQRGEFHRPTLIEAIKEWLDNELNIMDVRDLMGDPHYWRTQLARISLVLSFLATLPVKDEIQTGEDTGPAWVDWEEDGHANT